MCAPSPWTQDADPERVIAELEQNNAGSVIISVIQFKIRSGMGTSIFSLFSEAVGGWDPSLRFLCLGLSF